MFKKRLLKVVTPLIFHPEIFWSNITANLNVKSKLVRELVFHPEISALNWYAL